MHDFIREYQISKELCEELIIHFHTSMNKRPGECGRGVDLNVKRSTDSEFTDLDTGYGKLYHDALMKCVDAYCDEYPFAEFYCEFSAVEPIRLQWYKPGESFRLYHCERGSVESSMRHLVFITYLNDIDVGGETEFYHQQLKVKPETGKTLIWPSDWTFTHRGVVAPHEHKYIVTGWLSYPSPP